jgi:hypothetical protein
MKIRSLAAKPKISSASLCLLWRNCSRHDTRHRHQRHRRRHFRWSCAGAKDTAKVAMADAYQGLKSLIKEKFGHDSDVAEAIDR